jgi:hypothetical protein
MLYRAPIVVRLAIIFVCSAFIGRVLGATGSPALHLAASQCDIPALLNLISTGADLNQTDESGVTALHVAARVGCTEGVSQLVDRGANKNAQDANGETPLMVAAANKNYEAAHVLFSVGANIALVRNDGATAESIAKDAHANNIAQLLHNEMARRHSLGSELFGVFLDDNKERKTCLAKSQALQAAFSSTSFRHVAVSEVRVDPFEGPIGLKIEFDLVNDALFDTEQGKRSIGFRSPLIWKGARNGPSVITMNDPAYQESTPLDLPIPDQLFKTDLVQNGFVFNGGHPSGASEINGIHHFTYYFFPDLIESGDSLHFLDPTHLESFCEEPFTLKKYQDIDRSHDPLKIFWQYSNYRKDLRDDVAIKIDLGPALQAAIAESGSLQITPALWQQIVTNYMPDQLKRLGFQVMPKPGFSKVCYQK